MNSMENLRLRDADVLRGFAGTGLHKYTNSFARARTRWGLLVKAFRPCKNSIQTYWRLFQPSVSCHLAGSGS